MNEDRGSNLRGCTDSAAKQCGSIVILCRRFCDLEYGFLFIDYNTYTESGLFVIIISGSNVAFENESVHSEKV